MNELFKEDMKYEKLGLDIETDEKKTFRSVCGPEWIH